MSSRLPRHMRLSFVSLAVAAGFAVPASAGAQAAPQLLFDSNGLPLALAPTGTLVACRGPTARP